MSDSVGAADLSLDNARVNRADKLCKLVKLESDTMGGHDHPTTGQPQRLGRFGSTLCYTASRVGLLHAQTATTMIHAARNASTDVSVITIAFTNGSLDKSIFPRRRNANDDERLINSNECETEAKNANSVPARMACQFRVPNIRYPPEIKAAPIIGAHCTHRSFSLLIE